MYILNRMQDNKSSYMHNTLQLLHQDLGNGTSSRISTLILVSAILHVEHVCIQIISCEANANGMKLKYQEKISNRYSCNYCVHQ